MSQTTIHKYFEWRNCSMGQWSMTKCTHRWPHWANMKMNLPTTQIYSIRIRYYNILMILNRLFRSRPNGRMKWNLSWNSQQQPGTKYRQRECQSILPSNRRKEVSHLMNSSTIRHRLHISKLMPITYPLRVMLLTIYKSMTQRISGRIPTNLYYHKYWTSSSS